MAGIVLLAAAMVSMDQGPVELESRSQMQAQMRAAAQSARSWAAQAFGNAGQSEEHVQELAPQREKPAMFRRAASLSSAEPSSASASLSEHRPVVQSARGTELSSRAPGMQASDKGFYNDALAQLGAPPSIAQLKAQYGDASFASDAQAQLPPAPRLSSLHRSSHHTHRAEDDADADAPEEEEEGAAAAVAPRQQQLAEGRYGLAPETRGSITGEAHDFGAQLQRMQEQRAESKQAAAAAAKHRLKAKRTADAMGIPEGRGEGFHLTRYASAAKAKEEEEPRREEGISSHEADKQLMSYFSTLVADSHEKKLHRPAHKYFRARDQARQESLSEVKPAASRRRSRGPRVARDLHVSEYAAAEKELGKAPVPREVRAHEEVKRRRERKERQEGSRREGARASKGQGGDGLTPQAKQELQARLDAAYKTIENLTKEEEKRLVKRTRATVLKAEEKLGGIPHSLHSSTTLSPLAGGGAKGLKDAMEDHLAERAVKASASNAAGALPETQSHDGAAALRSQGMSSQEARDDLMSSMDKTFSASTEQDKIDRLKLHRMAPKEATEDIMNYLKDQAAGSHEQNLKDMRHLAHPFHTDPRVQIRRQERDKSLEEEQEYESALRDAFKTGPLPTKPVPTH